jgi:hypothetical protein
MKKLNRVVAPLIAVAMLAGAGMILPAQNFVSSSTDMSTVKDWQKTPAGMNDLGYQDGLMALKLDVMAKRPIDFKLGNRYVHPPVKKGAERDAYRAAYEAGYKAAMQHTPLS